MRSHRHVFERICTLENLLAAATDALRGKRQRGPGFRFWIDLEPEICDLHDELQSGSYRHGPYTYFTIHEPKERLVAEAARLGVQVVSADVSITAKSFFLSRGFCITEAKSNVILGHPAPNFRMEKKLSREPDAAPNSGPPSQLPVSPDIQTSVSLRTPFSGGCG